MADIKYDKKILDIIHDAMGGKYTELSLSRFNNFATSLGETITEKGLSGKVILDNLSNNLHDYMELTDLPEAIGHSLRDSGFPNKECGKFTKLAEAAIIAPIPHPNTTLTGVTGAALSAESVSRSI